MLEFVPGSIEKNLCIILSNRWTVTSESLSCVLTWSDCGKHMFIEFTSERQTRRENIMNANLNNFSISPRKFNLSINFGFTMFFYTTHWPPFGRLVRWSLHQKMYAHSAEKVAVGRKYLTKLKSKRRRRHLKHCYPKWKKLNVILYR